MSLAIKLQSATGEFQKLQGDMGKVVEARQKLEAQLSENELVKKVSNNLFLIGLDSEMVRNFQTSRPRTPYTNKLAPYL